MGDTLAQNAMSKDREGALRRALSVFGSDQDSEEPVCHLASYLYLMQMLGIVANCLGWYHPSLLGLLHNNAGLFQIKHSQKST